jgi:hypothetical protein
VSGGSIYIVLCDPKNDAHEVVFVMEKSVENRNQRKSLVKGTILIRSNIAKVNHYFIQQELMNCGWRPQFAEYIYIPFYLSKSQNVSMDTPF